jgi:hypothetical protein
MADPEPIPTIGDKFEQHAQTVVRAIIAVGSFAVIAVATAMGTADTIPSYFIGLAGIAIGFFIGGVGGVLKK